MLIYVKRGVKMSKFIIQGGKKLEGEVKISGSKNAALPILAATLLNAGKTVLYNVPEIQDVQTIMVHTNIRKNLFRFLYHNF